MIKEIDNRNNKVANQIYSIFQASYKIEAELLQATDFPPLKRDVNEFIISNNKFYAYYLGNDLAGIIELEINKISIHIQSLVVYPQFFRQGLGKKLVNFVFNIYNGKLFTVETGLANQPAINLYKSVGFKEIDQWDTDHNVRKVRFQKD